MRRLPARLALLAAVFVLALGVSSCSRAAEGGHTDGHQHSATAADFNADDVAFARDMIPHHEQAVELSALVPTRTDNAELAALAQQIDAAQQPEIHEMTELLEHWGADTGGGHGDGAGHGGHGTVMQGMVDEATMSRLGSLRGAEFDTLWLQSMIAHHQGAIEMAKAELANGVNSDAKALANSIIASQGPEIDRMDAMLSGGSGA